MILKPERKLAAPCRCASHLVLSLCLLGVTSCQTPSIEHESWPPLTSEEVMSGLGSPTAEFKAIVPDNVQATLEQVLPGVIEAARFVGHVAYVVSDLSESDHTEEEDSLPKVSNAPQPDENAWGTSLYLRLACPGDSLSPPYSFDNGELRLDSPELRGLDLGSLIAGGQFLMSFDECRIGGLHLNARFPGRYVMDVSPWGIELPPSDPDYPHFGLAIDFDVDEVNAPVGIVGFACGSTTTTCQDDVRIVAELKTSSGTFVTSLRVTSSYWNQATSTAVEIRAKNGSSRCTLTTPHSGLEILSPSLTCDDPTGP